MFLAPKARDTKIKNLKRSFVSCVDHNKVSGNDRKKCSFYDELHEYFREVTPFSQKDYAAPFMVPVNGAKMQLRMLKIAVRQVVIQRSLRL